MRIKVLTGLLLAVGTVNPGMAQWVEPSSGVLFDAPTRSIRRISGFLGAAQLSKPLVDNLDWASVAPGGHRAIAATSSGDLVWLEGIGQPDYSSIPVQAAGAGPFQARWASNSSSVRLYSAGCSCLFTVSMRLGQPVLTADPQYLDPTSGAVHDFYWEASRTLIVTDAGLYEFRGGQLRMLLPAEPGLSLLLADSGSLWAARAATGEISQVVLHPGREAGFRVVATDPERLTDVTGIVSVPGTLFAVDRKTRSVLRIAVESGSIQDAWPLESAPGRLTSLAGRSVWIVGDRSSPEQPVNLLDSSGGGRVLFVPAGGELQ